MRIKVSCLLPAFHCKAVTIQEPLLLSKYLAPCCDGFSPIAGIIGAGDGNDVWPQLSGSQMVATICQLVHTCQSDIPCFV